MPKGFTPMMLKYICDIADAALHEDSEAARSASGGLYNELVEDKKTATSHGVPDEFYREAQRVEIVRALNAGFPTKRLGIQYTVEQKVSSGDIDGALRDAEQEPNLLQRAALYDTIGRSDLARDAAVKGLTELLTNLPVQYQVAGKTSHTLSQVVTEASRTI